MTLGNDRISAEQQVARVSRRAGGAVASRSGSGADPELRVVPPVTLDKDVVPGAAGRRRRSSTWPGASALCSPPTSSGSRPPRRRSAPRRPATTRPSRRRPATIGRGRTSPAQQGVYGDPTGQYVATFGIVVNWNLFEGRTTSANVQRANLNDERTRLVRPSRSCLPGDERDRPFPRRLPDPLRLGRARRGEPQVGPGEPDPRRAPLTTPAPAPRSRSATRLLNLTRAELTLLAARIDAIIARADLNRAVGGAL